MFSNKKAFPRGCVLAMLFNTDKYVENETGTCCIFNIINGNISMTNGNIRLNIGDVILITETHCKKADDLFKYFSAFQSMYEYFSRK
jgi:hypothetical protein